MLWLSFDLEEALARLIFGLGSTNQYDPGTFATELPGKDVLDNRDRTAVRTRDRPVLYFPAAMDSREVLSGPLAPVQEFGSRSFGPGVFSASCRDKGHILGPQ